MVESIDLRALPNAIIRFMEIDKLSITNETSLNLHLFTYPDIGHWGMCAARKMLLANGESWYKCKKSKIQRKPLYVYELM